MRLCTSSICTAFQKSLYSSDLRFKVPRDSHLDSAITFRHEHISNIAMPRTVIGIARGFDRAMPLLPWAKPYHCYLNMIDTWREAS
jgi:hypothetical protein